MEKSLLHIRGGNRAVEESESSISPPAMPENEASHEWEPSHLDLLCVEELSVVYSKPRGMTLAPDSRMRRRALRSSKSFTDQYQLSIENGYLILKRRVLSCGKVLLRGISELYRQPQQTHDSLNPASSLLRLPPELRLRVYRHLLLTRSYYPIFHGPRNFHLQIHLRHPQLYPGDLWPEILATCKLIHQEGTPILYGENTFEQQFSWPPKRLFSSIPWPQALTSKLSNMSVGCISSMYLSDQHHKWLDDRRELQIFQSFPGLQYLKLRIPLAALSPEERVEMESLLENSLKSVSQKPKPLRRCRYYIRLPWDSALQAWSQAGAKDFSPHRKLKTHLERIMKENSLFTHQRVIWHFETLLSQYVGPDANLNFVIEHVGSVEEGTEKPGIHCEVTFDGSITQDSVEQDVP